MKVALENLRSVGGVALLMVMMVPFYVVTYFVLHLWVVPYLVKFLEALLR